jgi:hypothetical protein
MSKAVCENVNIPRHDAVAWNVVNEVFGHASRGIEITFEARMFMHLRFISKWHVQYEVECALFAKP